MSQLNSTKLDLYPLPYTTSQPPQELVCPVQTVSESSDTTAFNTGLDNRDMFLGLRRCVICGFSLLEDLKRCHIVDCEDIAMWRLLRELGWAPEGVKESPGHESRNGILMCSNHSLAFDKLRFFVRYQPTTKQYIFVHYDSCGVSESLEESHGKAIALDIKDIQAPLPLLFLAHEYRVRGKNFYQPTPDVKVTSEWQEWVTEGVVNEKEDGSFTFNRKAPTSGPPAGNQSSNVQRSPTQVPSTSGQTVIKPPTVDLIEELMACQRAMPSWKAWQTEAMGWEGTAEENIEKYVRNVGVEWAE